MKGFYLTANQLTELREAHRKARRKNAAAAYKINAVILLGTGWNFIKVKEALLLNEDTLKSYVSRYQEGGILALLETNYKGGVCRLTESELDLLVEELDTNVHLTSASVCNFIEKEFDEKYTESGVRDLLNRLGYTYKKPKLVPGNPDTEVQEIFIEQYEDFMLKKDSDTEVLFLDAVHPEHNPMPAYGWIKKGEKKELKTNSGRERLNLHGAINAETMQVTIIESETVNSESTINLLSAIECAYPASKEIQVILDNAKYHYSLEVQEYLKDSRVKLVFLPSYSPNLNLIERLWKFFKGKVLYNHYYKSLSDFRKSCIDFFKNIGDHYDELRSLMSGGFEMV